MNLRASNKMNQCQFTLICENLWLNYKPFLKKQTQFFPFLSPKTAFCPKTKPIKANQSQFKPNFIPFYAKQTQTSLFSTQKQQFSPKTNPKQTQTKPNHWIAKMNLYHVLTKRYEKIRLFKRNENKPKTNPISSAEATADRSVSICG